MLSELCFTASTIFSKLLTNSSDVSALEVTFSRFFLGWIVASVIVYKNSISLVPNTLSLLVWRGVLNTVAVILFFLASQYTTITNTHMLNMTYPFFIFLFAPLFFRQEKISSFLYLILVAALVGIWLVINPDLEFHQQGRSIRLVVRDYFGFCDHYAEYGPQKRFDDGDSLLSDVDRNGIERIGDAAGFRLARRPPVVAASGIGRSRGGGQICITYGYKYITARAGSLVSTSRILYAVVLGMLIFSEDLTLRIAAGGFMILLSIVAVTLLQKPENRVI